MKVKTYLARIIISVSFIALTACGGSEEPFVCAPPTCTLTSQALLDGVVSSTNAAQANGFITQPSTGDFGSVSPSFGTRQFYSFDITSIPATATVTSATLRLFQAFTDGQPYTVLGNVLVDHLDYGSSLNGTAYNLPSIAGNIGTLSTNTTLEYKELVVTSSVLNDIAISRTRSQYRIRFSLGDSNSDSTDDFVMFTDGEGSCCAPNIQPPQLVLTLN